MQPQLDQSISDHRRVEPDIERFSPDSCLLSTLQQVRRLGGVAMISHADAGKLWVDPIRGIYCTQLHMPEAMFRAPVSALEVRSQASLPASATRRAIDELYWLAAWHGSNGALLDGCEPYDVVALAQWPNFTRLPYRQSMIALCALLHNRPTSLSFAYRSLKIAREDAFLFYSAARAAGLVAVISAQPGKTVTDEQKRFASVDENVPNRFSGFWKNFVKKISGL